MVNKVILMGRLTKEPELKYTQDSTAVTRFSLAVDRPVSRENANKPDVQTVDFFDIVCWRREAEFTAKYFRKGQLVAIVGRLQQRQWVDRDNNKRTSVEIVASEAHFAEKKSDSQQQGAPGVYSEPPQQRGSGTSGYVAGGFVPMSDDDGELPFGL